MKCSDCGAQVPPDSTFCHNCGARLSQLREAGARTDLQAGPRRAIVVGAAIAGVIAFVVLGILLVDPFGGGGETSSSNGVSPIPTFASEAEPPDPSPEPETTGTPPFFQRSPEPSEPFEIVATGFEDDETKASGPSERDGWRRAGVYLDLSYQGGLGAARLRCSFDIHATLTASNGGTYELLPQFARDPGYGHPDLPRCGPLYPKLKIRLYFELEVPETLATLGGSSVDVQLFEMESAALEGQYEEADIIMTKSVSLQNDLPFEQTDDLRSNPFGLAVPINGGSLRIDSVALTGDRGEDGPGSTFPIHATLTYTLENSSPYDLASPFAEPPGEHLLSVAGGADDGGGLLIDALGHPYALSSSDCVIPPGMTRTCTAEVSGTWGPIVDERSLDTQPPDLTEVLIVTADGPYLFRGP